MLHHSACSAYERKGNIWYMMPQYSQCRKALWNALNPHTGKLRLEEAFPPEIRRSSNNQDMSITLKNGSTFQLVGSDNYNSLVGSTPIGLVFSEYALSDPSSWGFLRPILLENNGWVAFNSTPRGKNHFHKLFNMASRDDRWFSQILTSDDTGVFTQEQLQNELREMQDEHGSEYGHALWLQEYFCSFDAALPGSIWADCIAKASAEGRIGAFHHVEGIPVHTGWDLGFDDDTAVWFYQVINGMVRFIHYFDDRFKDVEFYANKLRTLALQNGWEYGVHWLPHDARPRLMAAGGKSIYQQFNAFDNIGAFNICPRLDVEEGIQAGRATLARSEFNEETTTEGVDFLKAYRREYDSEKKVFSIRPLHDFNSHAADAFRTVSLTWRQAKNEVRVVSDTEKLMRGSVGMLRMAELKKYYKERANHEKHIYG